MLLTPMGSDTKGEREGGKGGSLLWNMRNPLAEGYPCLTHPGNAENQLKKVEFVIQGVQNPRCREKYKLLRIK